LAKYKVLQSVAHNFAHSFVSVMNYAGNDYAMCHLIRRAKVTGTRRLRLDVLTRTIGPIELLSPKLVLACEHYCKDFGRFVTAGGAALDMIDRAELDVVVRLGTDISGKRQPGHVTARVRIRDDRGRVYEGKASESYSECAPPSDGAA
jgi:hypothetical protein